MKVMNNSRNQWGKIIMIIAALALVLGGVILFVNWDRGQTANIDTSVVDMAMAPGQDETEMNFSWYSPETDTPGVLEITRIDAEADGQSETITAELKEASRGFSGNEAHVTGLEPSAEYEYRTGDGNGNWNETNTFTTHDTESFNFLLMGDPQIGSSGSVSNDLEGWTDTLEKAIDKYPETSFIQSVGDQVEESDSEEQYSAYFTPDVLKRIPVATTIGNHDKSAYYASHFNVPNETEFGYSDDAGGDYSFTYDDVLFMNLNTNSHDIEEHTQFMTDAVEATADLPIKWRIVVFHHSIYSAGGHSVEDIILNLREGLVPIFDELEIDAALMGHDHSYARTYQMKNFELLSEETNENGAVINPEGTVYLTANSSSGSKYYNLADTNEPYEAVEEQLEVPTFTNVNITPDSLGFETYRTDTMEKVDEYKIIKD